jgi:hypothetical protein
VTVVEFLPEVVLNINAYIYICALCFKLDATKRAIDFGDKKTF